MSSLVDYDDSDASDAVPTEAVEQQTAHSHEQQHHTGADPQLDGAAAGSRAPTVGGMASLTEGTAAGTNSSKRLLGSRYAAHALFHRQSAAAGDGAAAARTEDAPTTNYDDAGAAETSEAPPGFFDGTGYAHQYGYAGPSLPPPYSGGGDNAGQYYGASPASTSHFYQHSVSLTAAHVQLPSSLDASHMERAARRGLGLELFDGRRGEASASGGGGEYDAALAAAAFGTAAGANSKVVEISGAALRGQWVPPVSLPGGQKFGGRASQIATPVWNPEAGAVEITKVATSSQKRKNQINSLASSAASASLKSQDALSRGHQMRALNQAPGA